MMHVLNKLFVFKQWFIAVRSKTDFAVPFNFSEFHLIQPSRGRFFADPFLIEQAGRHYVFFEDLIFNKRKGVISCCELDEKGNAAKPQVVLERPYHLAYPFLIKVDGEIYMIPDTGANKTIELYKSIEFPFRWRLEKVLMSGLTANDSTIFYYQGKYWLFTYVMAPQQKEDRGELHLFYADSIIADWRPHPLNPIKNDPRSTRPAGSVFIQDGRVIRPTQNCQNRYGESIVFNEISCLSENSFAEKQLFEIGPDWRPNNQRLHTYNSNDRWEVIDGLIEVFDILKPVRRLQAYWYSQRQTNGCPEDLK